MIRTETPMVDNNEQCPTCARWFKEGWPLRWHIRAVHSGEYNFKRKANATKEQRQDEAQETHDIGIGQGSSV